MAVAISLCQFYRHQSTMVSRSGSSRTRASPAKGVMVVWSGKLDGERHRFYRPRSQTEFVDVRVTEGEQEMAVVPSRSSSGRAFCSVEALSMPSHRYPPSPVPMKQCQHTADAVPVGTVQMCSPGILFAYRDRPGAPGGSRRSRQLEHNRSSSTSAETAWLQRLVAVHNDQSSVSADSVVTLPPLPSAGGPASLGKPGAEVPEHRSTCLLARLPKVPDAGGDATKVGSIARTVRRCLGPGSRRRRTHHH